MINIVAKLITLLTPYGVIAQVSIKRFLLCSCFPIGFLLLLILTRAICYKSVLLVLIIVLIVWWVAGYLVNIRFSVSNSLLHRGKTILSLLCFCCVLSVLLMTFVYRQAVAGVDIVVVKSVSMEPALCDGDLVVVNAWFSESQLHKGAVVTFTDPQYASYELIKRIVAIEGDAIHFAYDGFDVADKNTGNIPDNYRTISRDHYFLVGDNLLNSRDSRQFGPVDLKSIKGIYQYKIKNTCPPSNRN
ncbi:signal peptidase I [Gynuella sunshinyii]|uniref:Signal peptidase I n=1 Tax=Gynuella sunshinyii YC6258 TaxID=1445510 RepID=A0A0C5VHN0_9GAMM|nr:signal peptidase I [Gynuella sunshinyii]AJQ92853.1 signal peptidase I [Gynuella sunshinyii YC6258]